MRSRWPDYSAQLAFALGDFGSQRWRDGKPRYRPPGEVFDPRPASVQAIDERSAKAFVQRVHYSASMPAGRYWVGLFVRRPFEAEFLGGVAVFSHPMTQAVLPRWLGVEDSRAGVELGRFCLLDHDALATNAESWFLARAFRLLREAKPTVRGVLAFCDPVERVAIDGTVIKPGHCGVIYRATGAVAAGRSTARRLMVAPTGRVISARAISKIRAGDQGTKYAERQLVENGAPPRGRLEDGSAYIDRLVNAGFFRYLQHPGNLAFTWRFES